MITRHFQKNLIIKPKIKPIIAEMLYADILSMIRCGIINEPSNCLCAEVLNLKAVIKAIKDNTITSHNGCNIL